MDASGSHFFPDADFPIDPLVDLDLFPDGVVDTSFSGPSGRGFEVAIENHNDQGDNGMDLSVLDTVPRNDTEPFRSFPRESTPAGGEAQGAGHPHGPRDADGNVVKSALKRSHRDGSSEGSIREIEEELEVPKKSKKTKKVTFDNVSAIRGDCVSTLMSS